MVGLPGETPGQPLTKDEKADWRCCVRPSASFNEDSLAVRHKAEDDVQRYAGANSSCNSMLAGDAEIHGIKLAGGQVKVPAPPELPRLEASGHP